jgi:alanine dehydrogenase
MLAKWGLEEAVAKDKALQKGVNVYKGYVCCEAVAKDLGMEYRAFKPQ